MAVTVPDPPWQPSLLAGGEAEPDPAFGSIQRRDLSLGAWVEHAPAWLRGADALFEQLSAGMRWEAHERPMYGQVVAQPRLSAGWDFGPHDPSVPAVIGRMADLLGARCGVELSSLGCNLYRTGRDSVAWHGDRVLRDAPTATVAIVSLGAPRRFLLRPRGGGPSLALRPGPGDLLVMGGTCQRTWQHCVPKVASAGPRISVTFRQRL